MGLRWNSAMGGGWPRVAGALIAILCLGVVAVHADPQARQGVQSVRFGGDVRETRIVIEMDRSARGRAIENSASRNAAVVELAGIQAGEDLEGHGQGLVAGWAFDHTLGGSRLTLQLTKPAHIARRFLLPPSDGVGVYRYVTDSNGPAMVAVPVKTAGAAPAGAALTPIVSVATPLHLKKVIVIDAGHGGKDPGAAGAVSREKDINLAAAKALRARLEKTGRYRVVMTRDTDTFVPLETRVQIARRADADLFISLHSDSGPAPGVRGATVYTLSDKGSDRVVRGVMNQSDWFINVNLPGRDRAVNQILLDLTQRATRNRSAAFAEDLLDHIGDRVPLLERSHRDAGFVVLLAPDVPAVLLEMGFITNAQDESLLTNPGKRDHFMAGVADSIADSFSQPTRIAAR